MLHAQTESRSGSNTARAKQQEGAYASTAKAVQLKRYPQRNQTATASKELREGKDSAQFAKRTCAIQRVIVPSCRQ